MIDVSPFVEALDGAPVLVYGLGASNMAAIRALLAADAIVWAGDDKPERLQAARDLGASVLPDIAQKDFADFACLVLAPGIPLTVDPHPVVRRAREAGVGILCDVEIFHRSRTGMRSVGITGTNGKSTTTALTAHILRECGVPCVMGGNIGAPVLSLDAAADAVAVLELSSFQLDLCPDFAPDIAVHLNLTPDHLDRHGSLQAYAAAKLRLFRGRGEAIVGTGDALSRDMFDTVAQAGERTLYEVSVAHAVDQGVYARDGELFDALLDRAAPVMRLDAPALAGSHNAQNLAAAYAATRLLGCDADKIARAAKTFPGLNHRQFRVRRIGQVAYINDSKATNADATAPALAAFDRAHWIVGGKAKAEGLKGLERFAPKIRHAYLIGAAAESFAAWMDEKGIPYTMSRTLAEAVAAAHAAAGGTDTVLLSPACASYDQFNNFEERGDAFAALVNALPGGEG